MIELLRSRRSIRRFTSQPIPGHIRKILEESLLRSPSSRSICPWEFIWVDEPLLLSQLADAKPSGATFLKEAPLAVVICGREDTSDTWIEDCAIAAITVQYAAHSLVLGSCWIQIRNRLHASGQTAEAYVRNMLGLPSFLNVLAIIAIGAANEKKTPHPADSLLFNKIHLNSWTGE